jgi:hypothetical protein
MYIQALLTLTGSAQKLSTATGVYKAGGISTNAALGNIACREIHIQPAGANNDVVKFGDTNISSTLYSFQLPPGDSENLPCPPMVMGPYGNDVVKLGDIYALGTLNEVVHIGLVI